ncbi:MAG: hypothetical protein ABI759_29970 [Candidatus Solibacter sp.]
MIFCRHCDIALPNNAVTCPMCGRNTRLSVRIVATAGGILVGVLLLGGLLVYSARIKARVQRNEISNEEVLKEAQRLVSNNSAVRNPVGFSGADQTTIEHWDGRRWRVSGYIDTHPQPGVKVRTLYFAVLLNNGSAWNLEDLQLQSMEFGTGGGKRN